MQININRSKLLLQANWDTKDQQKQLAVDM